MQGRISLWLFRIFESSTTCEALFFFFFNEGYVTVQAIYYQTGIVTSIHQNQHNSEPSDYRPPVFQPDPARLTLKDVHDWGYVFVADRYVGLTSREESLYDLALTARPNQTLTVIVESGGRVTVGPYLKDFKVRAVWLLGT